MFRHMPHSSPGAERARSAACTFYLPAATGKVLRAKVDEIRQTGRSAQGVKTLTVDEGDRIAGIAVFEEKDAAGEQIEGIEDEAAEATSADEPNTDGSDGPAEGSE